MTLTVRFKMKRRRPVSYAEDDYSDESEYEEADRNRDIDNNKVRNGRNRESRSGEIKFINLKLTIFNIHYPLRFQNQDKS